MREGQATTVENALFELAFLHPTYGELFKVVAQANDDGSVKWFDDDKHAPDSIAWHRDVAATPIYNVPVEAFYQVVKFTPGCPLPGWKCHIIDVEGTIVYESDLYASQKSHKGLTLEFLVSITPVRVPSARIITRLQKHVTTPTSVG